MVIVLIYWHKSTKPTGRKRTMKKICFAACLLFVFSALFAENSKNTVEISGGANLLAMTEYNKSIDQQNASMEGMGYIPDLNKITMGGFVSLEWIYIFPSDIGLWGFYGKNDFLIVQDQDSVVYWPDGTTKALSTNINFNIDYLGFGMRRYFMDTWEVKKPNVFIGLDLGVMYSMGNKIDGTAYNSSGAQTGTLSVVPSAFLFGANAEIGADFWFTEGFGLNIKAGYRYSKGDLTGKYVGTGVYLSSNGNDMKQPVDYSGFYLNGGISVSFDSAKAVKNK